MKNEFLKNLKSYNLEGFGVLLAVSGGKDSMTMLDLFNYFKYELKLNLVVCHFNHSLRDDADRDEKFVKTQCEKYGLKFYSKKEDVLLYSNENKLSTEEGARFLRYKFFDEVKRIENLEYIATAHNKNDLAETVIMRILRGTGINGLIGIQSERGDLIRPILNFSRDEIEKYIEENNIPFVEDKTNFEELYLRNKIRLNLFPILKNEYNPRILDAISRLSNIAFDYSTISREYIASKEGLLWEFNKEKILVYIEKLKLQSRSFRNIMYREFFEFISKDPDGINYKIIEEIDNLIFSKTGKYIEIKNVVFKIEYDKLLIYDKNIFENLEMKFYFENLDFSLYSTKFFDIIIEQSSFEEFKNLKQNKDLLFINKKYLDFLKIRNKENGDFLELEFGKKKLKDIFIDEKVSKDIRKNIPIFEIENNIVWVPNIRRSNRYLVDEKDDIIKIRVLSKENLWKD
ncbi:MULTISPECIES: tRNA lysidine(34) synthetase TilS [Parvimonas]|jgi:tRNA(ile)-lysidine synthetase|uniref:tRNA(Ile)-lysidine synthase n=2 Tax=Parvimonas micra TaxID=33033 RepID=A0AAX3K8E8_9FIRM|nr:MULTISPECIES: tRNA lysidine(34) synthetase TilS [Parvimonas]AXU10650.1 tRNA lysidine(34) synthetase TilS [Parvimonas micra]MCK6130590.1 tRNA lysidine(34) synthetase TilS [Parvimonas micra]MCK6136237.1 tRNA lysidine(34) synthetase TilS [Parvimonas micra]MCK6137708.1 tRNA lysidine(34) synthetase TilS [Parvimonas micra]MCK6154236.1 tRNA lysidine(34) synthetase TilS [Parvimonas micra]